MDRIKSKADNFWSLSTKFLLLLFFGFMCALQCVSAAPTKPPARPIKCGVSPIGGKDPFHILNQTPRKLYTTRIGVTGKLTKMVIPAIIAPRILGGVTAPAGMIPWQVAIQSNAVAGYPGYYGFCSGTILSKTWVITAGHCCGEASKDGMYTKPGDVYVLAGNADNGQDPSNPLAQRVQAKQFFAHPKYSISGANVDGSLGEGVVVYDIALIELAKPMNFSKHVLPICMSRSGAAPFAREVGVISGYGSQTPNGSDATNVFKLKWAHVPMISDNDPRCFGNNTDPQDGLVTSASVMKSVVCAGGTVGTDTCPGDSGGPLFFMNHASKQHYLVGATSYGVGDDGNACGGQYAGRYAKISALKSWIKSHVKDISWIK